MSVLHVEYSRAYFRVGKAGQLEPTVKKRPVLSRQTMSSPMSRSASIASCMKASNDIAAAEILHPSVSVDATSGWTCMAGQAASMSSLRCAASSSRCAACSNSLSQPRSAELTELCATLCVLLTPLSRSIVDFGRLCGRKLVCQAAYQAHCLPAHSRCTWQTHYQQSIPRGQPNK